MENNQLISDLLTILSFDGEQHDGLDGAPFGEGNRDCLVWFLKKAEDFGFKCKNLSGYAGVADLGDGEPFGILGHLDTVPVGEGWTHNPYGEIVDDVIYGRGILDDRGPMLITLYAIKSLLDDGLTPKKNIRVIVGCNEESGWKCIDHFNKVEKMPSVGFSPDADFPVINCEKGIAEYTFEKEYNGNIKIFGGTRSNVVPNLATAVLRDNEENLKIVKDAGLEYSIKDGKITALCHGTAAHAATPNLGDNAIVKLLKILSPLDDDLKLIYNTFKSFDGVGAGLNLKDDISGALTVNLGVIDVSDKIRFTINIRYPVTIKDTTLMSILDKALPSYIVTFSRIQEPLYVDKDDELVTTLLNVYNEITGENLRPITIGGGTYARALKHGVAFGPEFPGVISTIHMPDERAPISDIYKIFNIYHEAIKRLCF